MKKIIVTIALLLVATLALSVSAFGATAADFGAETYYLGAPVKTAPKLDGEIKADEYAVTYTLNAGVYYDNDNKVLANPADDKALTSAVKVAVAYDVENLYVAFEADLADTVATAVYDVAVAGATYEDLDVNVERDDVVVKQADGKITVEIVKALENDEAQAYGKSFGLVITEYTKNADDMTVNKSEWNRVQLSAAQAYEYGAAFADRTYVLGSEATLGTEVTVEQEPVGVPGQTNAPVTEAPTTEAPTTEPATEAPTTEPATEAPATEPATEAPATEAPTTEAPKAEGGCGSSVAVMGIALVAALGTCAVVVSKKKED